MELNPYALLVAGFFALIGLVLACRRAPAKELAAPCLYAVSTDPNRSLAAALGAIAYSHGAAWVNVDGKSEWKPLVTRSPTDGR